MKLLFTVKIDHSKAHTKRIICVMMKGDLFMREQWLSAYLWRPHGGFWVFVQLQQRNLWVRCYGCGRWLHLNKKNLTLVLLFLIVVFRCLFLVQIILLITRQVNVVAHQPTWSANIKLMLIILMLFLLYCTNYRYWHDISLFL